MNYYLLLAIIVLILLSAFFSATETAYSCANRIKLKTMAQNGNKRAHKVLKYCENFDKLITTVLIGNNIVNITAASLSTLFFIDVLKGTNIDATTISTVALTIVVLIFGEITPKFLANTYPEKFAMLFYPIIKFFNYLFIPLSFIFGGYKKLLTKLFKLKPNDIVTEEEIMTIVEEAAEDGTLKKEETNLIRSVIEFDDLEVADILVPRVNITAVNEKASMQEIKKVFVDDGFSRLPVYKDSIDTIIGTIHEKDFYALESSGKTNIDSIIQKAYYTTEHIKISKLLKSMQKRKNHIAIVLDEYGGTLGLVTIEDIIEELVGEIWDEHDEEINYFKKLNDTTVLVDCEAPLEDLYKFYELELDDNKFNANTVSGFIIELNGEIPRTGTKLKVDGLEIEVIKATNKRVLQIKVIKK